MTQPNPACTRFLPLGKASAIGAAIQQAESILCVSHVSPDGDAIGSLLGMGWILRSLGKNPTLALADKPSEDFAYIPGFHTIVGVTQVQETYDLIISMDAGSADRMGDVFRTEYHANIPLINIDHHITNTEFGTINWVEPRCAAVCQMLIYLAEALGVPATGNLAVALLTGLVTDTLGFRTSSTDACVLQAAVQLTEGGASIQEVVSNALQRRTFASLRLWGAILNSAELMDGVIWATFSLTQRNQMGATDRDTEGLANFLLSAREADISATFTERINSAGQTVVECSFRANPGFDVSTVAVSLGGGGHAPAAGCTLFSPLDTVVETAVAALRRLHREHMSSFAQSSQANHG